MVLNTHVILSLLASIAGSIGGVQQSNVISQPSARISKILAVNPSATGEFSTLQPNMPTPSVAVGAGGNGVKATQVEQASQKSDTRLSDQVGDMAESAQTDTTQSEGTASTEDHQGTVLEERSSDEPPNPKKRMWEERKIEPIHETRPRDEL